MKKYGMIAALAACTLLTGCLGLPSGSSEYKEPEKPVPNEVGKVNTVGDELDSSKWYGELCGKLARFNNTADVSEHVENRDIKKAYTYFRTSRPQFFWLGNVYYATTITDGSRVELAFTGGVKEKQIPRMYVELQAAADKLIQSIPDGSDYDKVLYVHDYLAKTAKYDFTKLIPDADMGLTATPYGCLVNKLCVCDGYARTFTYIMNTIGIESGVCTGSVHAWNYVKLDGEYYWLDITWDDKDINDLPVVHNYFLISTEQLLRTREFDRSQGYLFNCSTSDNNYYTRNGSYFKEYSNDVLDYIAGQIDSGTCEIMFADYESYCEAVKNICGKKKVEKRKEMSGKTVRILRCDDMYCLNFIFRDK